MNEIEERIAFVVLAGQPFSVDDVTEDGAWAPDPTHAANSTQNSIGQHIGDVARRGLIEFTGEVQRSCAPHRKGGMIRIWRPTSAGDEWARSMFEQ